MIFFVLTFCCDNSDLSLHRLFVLTGRRTRRRSSSKDKDRRRRRDDRSKSKEKETKNGVKIKRDYDAEEKGESSDCERKAAALTGVKM